MNNAGLHHAALKDNRSLQMRRGARGFTLVEVLVVLAVLALLVALLLPSLSQARAGARRIDCLSRQKQWAMAFRMYVDDHEERIPREGYERLGGVTLNNWIQVRGKRIAGTTTDSEASGTTRWPHTSACPARPITRRWTSTRPSTNRAASSTAPPPGFRRR